MNTIEAITLATLQGLLAARKGAQFVTFVACTDARLKKTGNPFAGPVVKISRVNGVVNFHYGNAVNRQRGREAESVEEFETFEPSPRKWGERLPGLPFVQHKGKVYLEVKVEKALGYHYEDTFGNVLTNEQVEPFLPARSSNADNQGIENEVILRDYDLANVREITFGGESYVIDPASVAVPLPEAELALA